LDFKSNYLDWIFFWILKNSKINVHPKEMFGQDNFMLVSAEPFFTLSAKCLFGQDHD